MQLFVPDFGNSSDFPERDLIEACAFIAAAEQDEAEDFGPSEAASRNSYYRRVGDLHQALESITRQPARTLQDLQAKAVALRALLHDGNGETLYDDATAPERLAWSLVNDLLALSPFQLVAF